MSNDKLVKELKFIEKMNNDYIFRNNEDALDRALNRESFFIEDKSKSLFAKILIENGLIDIKKFLSYCDTISVNKIVDSVIDGFFPLKINLYYEDKGGRQNFGIFDVSDNDCQFTVYPHDGLVKFTVQIDLLLPFKCPITLIDINKINIELLSEIGEITDLNYSIDLIEF
jgi:hypothetical protein